MWVSDDQLFVRRTKFVGEASYCGYRLPKLPPGYLGLIARLDGEAHFILFERGVPVIDIPERGDPQAAIAQLMLVS